MKLRTFIVKTDCSELSQSPEFLSSLKTAYNKFATNALKFNAEQISQKDDTYVETLSNCERYMICSDHQDLLDNFCDMNRLFNDEVIKQGASFYDVFHCDTFIYDEVDEAICVIGVGTSPPNTDFFKRAVSPS